MTNIIAIDGPAASGKGTLSRAIAEKMNYAHLDSGALYRAVAYEVLQAGANPENENHAVHAAQALLEKLRDAASPSDVLGNPGLREETTSVAASKVAAIQEVRDALVSLQRSFAAAPGEGYDGAVLDGRDIGTVICPEAPVKFFVTASLEIRAERRLKELQSKGIEATRDTVLTDMRERDKRDQQRQAAPLKPAEDAIVLDTSDLNEGEMLENALKIIQSKLSKP